MAGGSSPADQHADGDEHDRQLEHCAQHIAIEAPEPARAMMREEEC